MVEIKFDPKKLAKLNNPERLKTQSPEVFWPLLNLPDPKVIFDIGCGTGLFSIEMLKKAPNAKVIALDISQVMLDWLGSNREEVNEGRLVPMLMPEDRLPLESDIGDLAVMISLHHELHNPVGMVAEIYRTLKPGGTLMILDWKPQPTEKGPPLEIRVQEKTVVEQLTKAQFVNSMEHSVFEDFWMITAKKPPA